MSALAEVEQMIGETQAIAARLRQALAASRERTRSYLAMADAAKSLRIEMRGQREALQNQSNN